MKNEQNTSPHARYIPAPVDTSDVALPSSLLDLTEVISRNTHEVWARKRIDEGWRYGAQRDEENKLHPNLIPYEELSEEDKEYDRLTAMNAIRLMVKLGYSIVTPYDET
ncbi:MAG: Ryanodine receptor Ryr [Bacteroidales bacterium]|nr:Ryanodine receptor Ryr [Bacteroidales bacterium]